MAHNIWSGIVQRLKYMVINISRIFNHFFLRLLKSGLLLAITAPLVLAANDFDEFKDPTKPIYLQTMVNDGFQQPGQATQADPNVPIPPLTHLLISPSRKIAYFDHKRVKEGEETAFGFIQSIHKNGVTVVTATGPIEVIFADQFKFNGLPLTDPAAITPRQLLMPAKPF